MSLAKTLKVMAAAGCSAEQIVAVAEAYEAVEAEKAQKRREQNRIRQQRKRDRDSESRDVTLVTRDWRDSPHPPVSDKENPPAPPKEINSTPLTPQTTLQGASAQIDFDSLAAKIEEAGSGKIQPHSLVVIGPIAELIASGVSLDLDVLPTVKAISSRLNKTVNLSYFIGPIREAYERRIDVVRDLPKPKQRSEAEWEKILRFARQKKLWERATVGPMPGEPGCCVPATLLNPGDGIDWADMADSRRKAA